MADKHRCGKDFSRFCRFNRDSESRESGEEGGRKRNLQKPLIRLDLPSWLRRRSTRLSKRPKTDKNQSTSGFMSFYLLFMKFWSMSFHKICCLSDKESRQEIERTVVWKCWKRFMHFSGFRHRHQCGSSGIGYCADSGMSTTRTYQKHLVDRNFLMTSSGQKGTS